MMTSLKQGLRGLSATLLLGLNLILLSSVVFVLLVLRNALVVQKWRGGLDNLMMQVEFVHARVIAWVLAQVCCCRIVVESDLDFTQQQSYVLLANHRSLVDILVLIAACAGKIPLLKFFLKRSLAYVPFMGWFCYCMGYPFVDRARKRRGRKTVVSSVQSLYSDCQRVFKRPAALVLFAEGTRFAQSKVSSAYKHLLVPKHGALAAVLSLQRHQDLNLLDVDLYYPQLAGAALPWQLLSAQLPVVKVQLSALAHPQAKWLEQYQHGGAMRADFIDWLRAVWRAKDMRLAQFYTS